MSHLSVIEQGHIRTDRGLFLDKGNQCLNVLHSDFEGGAKGDGVHDDYPAIQAAINRAAEFCGTVYLPPGTYKIGTGLVINNAVTIYGGGSTANKIGPGTHGAGTTEIRYTGSGVAISIGTVAIADTLENVHLCDFILHGNINAPSLASGGVLWGAAAGLGGAGCIVSKGSMRNVMVFGFNATGAYGVRLKNVLELTLENLHVGYGYDGIVNAAGDVMTTIRGTNVYSRVNDRYGMLLAGSICAGSSFHGLLTESNGDAGLCILNNGVVGIDFFGYYSEADNTTSGTAPVCIGVGEDAASVPTTINFWGGFILDGVNDDDTPSTNERIFDLGMVDRVTVNDMYTQYQDGWMRATSDTTNCRVVSGLTTVTRAMVTDNAVGRVAVNNGTGPDMTSLTAIEIPKISATGVDTTASTADNTFVTLFTATAAGAYKVYAYIGNVGANYAGTCDVIFDGTNLLIVSDQTAPITGANLEFGVDGADLQAKQTSGAPQVIQYTYLRIA